MPHPSSPSAIRRLIRASSLRKAARAQARERRSVVSMHKGSSTMPADSIAHGRGAQGHAECPRAAPRTYLAGPMSGYPDLNFPAFHAAAARLRAAGLDVVNPAEINADPAADWSACMRADIAQLVTCDSLALLPGWTHSRGAQLERTIAAALGMRIGSVDDYLPAAIAVESEGGEL